MCRGAGLTSIWNWRGIGRLSDHSRQSGGAANLSVRGAQAIVAQLKPKKPLNEKRAAGNGPAVYDSAAYVSAAASRRPLVSYRRR